MKKVVVIGAGPAGLTGAYEFLRANAGYEVIVLEATDAIGGISRTVQYKGNRMDMGGHRFFSKVPQVNAWWAQILPDQGAPAWDDRVLKRDVSLAESGPDPESEDRVMLRRHRISRILFDNKFYDYPISLKPETFRNMGFVTTFQVGVSYIAALLHKREESNLENFYINRFGKKLYKIFFEYYTENLWGRHPSEIDSSWGGQRVKGLSVLAVMRDVLGKIFRKSDRRIETSLIEEFQYPKYGPGQMWETVAREIISMGGTIHRNARVKRLHRTEEGSIDSVIYVQDGEEHTIFCDYVLSSMPLRDLAGGMNNVPDEEKRIAAGLPYRDYMTLGVLVSSLSLKNLTKNKTIGNIVPDCWIYVQDRRVKMGRIQIYNNWSPYMVSDPSNTVWIGLEYFVNEGDAFWNMTEDEFAKIGIREMIQLGIITDAAQVLDTHMEKVEKAYPAYFDTYCEIDRLIAFLSAIPNLYCVGRNGQHRYNNMDHSMCTAFEAVNCILNGSTDKSAIWAVNTEETYHETK